MNRRKRNIRSPYSERRPRTRRRYWLLKASVSTFLLVLIIRRPGFESYGKVEVSLRSRSRRMSAQPIFNPRILFLHGIQFEAQMDRTVRDMWLGSRDIEYQYFKSEDILRNPLTLDGKDGQDVCVPAAEWQTFFFPTCNAFHELGFDLAGEQDDEEGQNDDLVQDSNDNDGSQQDTEEPRRRLSIVEKEEDSIEANGSSDSVGVDRSNDNIDSEDTNLPGTRNILEWYDDGAKLTMLGTGTSRDAWEVDTGEKQSMVLKTYHLDRKFSEEAFRHQVVDSIVSERLTSSPYVADIYGYCGLSVFNEIGKHLVVDNTVSLEQRLRYARDLSAGLADAHEIDNAPHARVVHADLRQNNVFISYQTNSIKLSDFNQGSFLGWNTRDQEPCGYRPEFSFWNDRLSAPEECIGGVQTEKTDVYHLGGMIFYFMTGSKPYTYNRADYTNRKRIMSTKAKWVLPLLPKELRHAKKNPAITTMRLAMEAATKFQAETRASAREVFIMLDSMLSMMNHTTTLPDGYMEHMAMYDK